jgi:glycosyltransferase involved in cell wall biosynthesis
MSISVIAPNFNEMPWIRDYFIRSLRAQTMKPHEIIVVDGGSTDHSESYATFTCKIRNIGYCRDLAAKRASGDIILSASTDVWYPPQTLEKLSKAFNDESVASVSGRIFPTECGVGFHLGYGLFEAYRKASRRNTPSASLYAVRRDILEKVGGYPHVLVREGEVLGELIENYSRVNGFKTLHQSGIIGLHHVKPCRTIKDYAYLFIPQLREAQGRRFSSK